MSPSTSPRTPAALAALDRGDEYVAFADPDARYASADLDWLRAHALPIAVGLNWEPGVRAPACRLPPPQEGTP